MGINRNIVDCKDGIQLKSKQADSCINRNIVECKDSTNNTKNNPYPVLIETLWNVKFQYITSVMWFPIVLIETLWNVKVFNS